MHSRQVKKIGVRLVFSWIFSVIFILAGLGSSSSSIASGIFFILGGLIILPPLGNLFEEKFNFKLTGWLKFFIFLVFLIIAFSTMSSDVQDGNELPKTDNSVNPEKDKSSFESSEKVYGFNERIVVENFAYTFTNLERRNSVGDYFGEDADGIFLIFSFEVENIGSEPDYVNDEIYIIDSFGREFAQDDSWYYLDDNIVFEELNPGLKKKGQIIFDVPEGVEGNLCIKKNLWSSDCQVLISYS